MRKALLADPDASYLGRPAETSPALERELHRFSGISDDVAAGRYAAAGSALHDEHDRLAGEVEVERELGAAAFARTDPRHGGGGREHTGQ